MKHIIDKIIKHTIIIYLILICVVFMLITSCSASYHVKKAVQKGFKIEAITDTISVPYIDSVLIVDKDSVVWHKSIQFKDTVIYLKTFTLPDTRQEIRQKEKTKRTEIKQENKTERTIVKNTTDIKQDSIKQTAKTERVITRKENRKCNRWNFFLIGMIVGITITIIFNNRKRF